MRAAVFSGVGCDLTVDPDFPRPQPGQGEVLIRVGACGVCRTDLHIIDGDLAAPKLPLVPGHEVVGIVETLGEGVLSVKAGDRVGVPWLGWTCGTCDFCRSDRENLCDNPLFTGYTRDGGYADFAIADARYCLPIPPGYSDVEAAPLLCAGLIGYRAWKMVRGARRLGLYGFGAAAHITAQIALYHGQAVFAFTRPGDRENQVFARKLGASWAGDSTDLPPQTLEAALIFAPVGDLVPAALAASAKGATIVCAGIHLSDIPSFPYSMLWEERTITSVANLTRQDGLEFMALAPRIPIRTTTTAYAIEGVGRAIADLRAGRINGAAVLRLAAAS